MDKKAKYFGLGILGGFIIVAIVIITFIFIPVVSMITGPNTVAVIPVYGEIAYGSSNETVTVSHPDEIKSLLNQANLDPSIGAIVLDINSPGGSPVASEEILNAVNTSQKPIISWISDTGTSGAYLVASGSDEIVASPSSWVGSIGIILTLTDLTEYYENEGIDIYSLTGGKYKDIGADYKTMTSEEKEMLQDIIDEEYQYFISLIADQRNLSIDYVETIADGRIFTGNQSLNLKLVDKLGGKDYAIDLAANMSSLGSGYQVITLTPSSGFLSNINV